MNKRIRKKRYKLAWKRMRKEMQSPDYWKRAVDNDTFTRQASNSWGVATDGAIWRKSYRGEQ